MSTTPSQLTTLVEDLPGIGPGAGDAFRQLGIRCLADLLLHLPNRYERSQQHACIAELDALVGDESDGPDVAAVVGEIASVRPGFGRRSKVEAVLEDDTGQLRLVFFNQPWVRHRLQPGRRLRVSGRPGRFSGQLQLVNPRFEPAPETPVAAVAAQLLPIYPASEALPSATIREAMAANLDEAVALLEDHLPEDYRQQRELITLGEAYRLIHRPTTPEDVPRARRRLAFDELLLLQLGVMMKRHHRHATLVAPALPRDPERHRRILARFPFSLTAAQQRVVDEIGHDLESTTPMNRLLQGDVGSGKTVVALYAMLLSIAEGRQAALMAPTEILAEQHHSAIRDMLAESRVRIEVLTASCSTAHRRSLENGLASGEIDMVIGTHALLGESIQFKDLAVVVIDEQHRFGVQQRALLRSRRDEEHQVPHQLVMTATPIPRTLSLTIFGDLDVSVIDERPPGRSPVITRAVGKAESARVYHHLAERVQQGQQGYVVVPMIEASDHGLTDVHTHRDHLLAGPLKDCRVEVMHGRLDAAARDDVMDRFRRREIDVLVATTVIEVGIDVPNATMIIIEQADRFGLAQLHQLRGRVGRGDYQGLCVLVADPVTEDGAARLDAIAETNDGFRVAERDLELRGPGELFGARQSGLAPFRVARLPDDLQWLLVARQDAAAWIEQDPRLSQPTHALLRKRLLKAHGEALGLGDVG
ncbi:MAG: ATP-dependent DNA helicase RecG [Phycisphaerales bacterium]|nr:ATP-dependent DNA helicase RecG [Phycisphaerales bacterium]